MVVASHVAHQHHAESFFGVEAHHVPESCPTAEVLEECGTLLPGLPGVKPAQPKVARLAHESSPRKTPPTPLRLPDSRGPVSLLTCSSFRQLPGQRSNPNPPPS